MEAPIKPAVAVTGLGVVVRDAIGLPAFTAWLMGGGGLPDRPAHFDTHAFRAQKAYATHPDTVREALAQYLEVYDIARLSDADLECAAHGLRAGAEALENAQILGPKADQCGIALATTSGGMMDKFLDTLADDGGSETGRSASYLEAAVPASTAAIMARTFGLNGPFANFSCACASSSLAISYAFSRIRSGDAPIMLVGGSDRMRAADYAGFNALRAMDRESCRPFDKGRRGMVIGDGAAMLVLEDEAHARERGVEPLAYLVDVGLSIDAHHITHPSPDGLSQAMRQALQRAAVEPDAVGYVNCHGTGTPVNDKAETEALDRIFPAQGKRPLISSTKGATGHLLGSAGAIEALITVLALRTRSAPAMNTTVTPEDTGFPMPGPDGPAPIHGHFAMSNSLGFGGINCSLLFQAREHGSP
ncbi:beta-ketoacyl-[acyl-carrier-protein] synthase family protein [Stappia sp.]|uniref:beta-ketoacyl-[acyl-carrier-protein] synthase family protein n=1 Tax=Stappia sp. TaxID=1870903 RepID=UPI0032D968EA